MGSACSTATFDLHWRATKARFDAAAPAWVARFFGPTAQAHDRLVERLVTQGKSARACLTLLVCEALGGDVEEALPRAVLIECVQAASLVHDDVVDGDVLRRGAPATWTVLGQRRAILLGDLMFATALMHAARLGQGDVLALAEAIGTVASGAWREPQHFGEARAGGPSLYERIVHCKTGALFGAAGRLGAIAAGADDARARAACMFATRVGEAYQMADDIADLLGAWPDVQHDAHKAAALATLRAHFAKGANGRRHDARTSAGWPTRDALRPHVECEIRRRVMLARTEIDAFAAGASAAMLHAAPEFIVALQASEA